MRARFLLSQNHRCSTEASPTVWLFDLNVPHPVCLGRLRPERADPKEPGSMSFIIEQHEQELSRPGPSGRKQGLHLILGNPLCFVWSIACLDPLRDVIVNVMANEFLDLFVGHRSQSRRHAASLGMGPTYTSCGSPARQVRYAEPEPDRGP